MAAIRTVALYEAFNGVVVLLAASGLLALIQRDVRAAAASFIEHLHLNPDSHLNRTRHRVPTHLNFIPQP